MAVDGRCRLHQLSTVEGVFANFVQQSFFVNFNVVQESIDVIDGCQDVLHCFLANKVDNW